MCVCVPWGHPATLSLVTLSLPHGVSGAKNVPVLPKRGLVWVFLSLISLLWEFLAPSPGKESL